MNFNDITIGQLLVLIAAITAIATFIGKVSTPVKTFEKRVSDLEQHLDNDNKRLKLLEQDTRLILKATRVLVLHGISSNNTGELKEIQEEIDDYLISK